MTCYHPLKAFQIGVTPTGKRDLKITSGDTDYVELVNGNWIARVNPKINESRIKVDTDTRKEKYLLIPCGQCIGCRIDYSRDWATRMMCELKYHEKASFITLTYDEYNVPISEYVDEDGVITPSLTLYPDHFKDFMKRLRRHFEPNRLRFYGCGEYGDESMRPHYHLILYGEDFKFDRTFLKLNHMGQPIYQSETLRKIWPYGFNGIEDVTWQNCAYTARYVQKKRKGYEKSYYEYFNIVPEFSRMSRRPGIGRLYYDEHKEEIYKDYEMFVSTMKGGFKTKPPRYYNKLYDIEYPDKWSAICEENMKKSDNISYLKQRETSKNLLELLAAEERVMSDKAKLLRRDAI